MIKNKTIESPFKKLPMDNDLIQIRRHKGTRGRLELYVHNSEFREWLNENKISVPTEEGGDNKIFLKKLLFKSHHFGQLMLNFCTYLFEAKQKQTKEDMEQLISTLNDEIKAEVAKDAENDEENGDENSDEKWDIAYRNATQKLISKLDLLRST